MTTKKADGVDIYIRIPEDVVVPTGLVGFAQTYPYVTNPVTIIDKSVCWFGQPIYAADFYAEGDIVFTECFPCARFCGHHAVRLIQAFLEL